MADKDESHQTRLTWGQGKAWKKLQKSTEAKLEELGAINSALQEQLKCIMDKRQEALRLGSIPDWGLPEESLAEEELFLSVVFDDYSTTHGHVSAFPIQSIVKYDVHSDGSVTKDCKYRFKQLSWEQRIIVPQEYGVQNGWKVEADGRPITVPDGLFRKDIPKISSEIKATAEPFEVPRGVAPGKYWWLHYNYTCALRVCNVDALYAFCVLFYPALAGTRVVVKLPADAALVDYRILRPVKPGSEGTIPKGKQDRYEVNCTPKGAGEIEFKWNDTVPKLAGYLRQMWTSKQEHHWPLFNVRFKANNGASLTKLAFVDPNDERWECQSQRCPG